jgi:type IV pilus assembly protein PilM
LATLGEAESAEEGSEKMDVMLVAAKKDVIDDYVSVLQLCRLSPMVLDVDAFALQNAFEISTDKPQGCYAVVNVGAQELGINAIKDTVSMFSRDSSFGGSQITDSIMSEFNVGFEEAEALKLGGSKADKQKRAIEEIFKSVVSEWVQEIRRALDFVASTYPDDTIEKILVCGGSVRIPGFKEYLEKATGIPVAVLNPFADLIIDERLFDLKYLTYMAPQAAVAVGLALRSIGDK